MVFPPFTYDTKHLYYKARGSEYAKPLASRFLAAAESGLPKDSVANVSQVITLDKGFLSGRCGRIPARGMKAIDDGLRLALSL
jgi:mRNA-degrading endonuclease toxin of MazEF toxin-antitoxin module